MVAMYCSEVPFARMVVATSSRKSSATGEYDPAIWSMRTAGFLKTEYGDWEEMVGLCLLLNTVPKEGHNGIVDCDCTV